MALTGPSANQANAAVVPDLRHPLDRRQPSLASVIARKICKKNINPLGNIL